MKKRANEKKSWKLHNGDWNTLSFAGLLVQNAWERDANSPARHTPNQWNLFYKQRHYSRNLHRSLGGVWSRGRKCAKWVLLTLFICRTVSEYSLGWLFRLATIFSWFLYANDGNIDTVHGTLTSSRFTRMLWHNFSFSLK